MTYDRHAVESKWQDAWEEWGIYRFDPDSDAPIYSIDNPPRYASGVLHMGHATQYTLIDIAARYKRMRGYNVFFPLCFDLNGMPIEVAVERKYGVSRHDTPRQKLVEMCREFANANVDEMTRQYKILGESMDPSIYYQTDEPYYRRITQLTFIDLVKKGLVYRKEHPINWCTHCVTALSDADVEYGDREAILNYIAFETDDGEEFLIATTRPELLCTCQMVAVSPDVEDAARLEGKTATVPIFGRRVPILVDDNVEATFGTGVMMICSFGDKDDVEWICQHDLPMEKGVDEEGRMTAQAGEYEGMTTVEAREAIVRSLEELGLLRRREPMAQSVGQCWRCHCPVEYLLKEQWFLNLLDFKEDVLRVADEVRWFPEFMKIRLQNWTNSLAWDWCLSRQRYFATPIPVWYCVDCQEVVVADEDQPYVDPTTDAPPVDSCPKCGGALRGEEDVFDTWMDSSITPLFNAHWKREGEEEFFPRLYPMSLRPQSHDIIRNWAFYTILREYQLVGQKPWDDIIITAFILAEDGSPMHTALGNVIDPLPVVEEYGADAFRYFVSQCGLGTDHPYKEKEVVRGYRFATKLWNLYRFIGDTAREGGLEWDTLRIPEKWILSLYSELVEEATAHCDGYAFDRAMRAAEFFAWHVLADHYLEMVKHRREEPAVAAVLHTVGLGLLKLIAPVLPHIAEELYQAHFASAVGERSVHLLPWPEPVGSDEGAEERGEALKDAIAAIRGWKSDLGIPLSQELASVEIGGERATFLAGLEDDIASTMKVGEVRLSTTLEVKEEAVAVRPRYEVIGPAFREKAEAICEALGAMDPGETAEALAGGSVTVTAGGEEVVLDASMVVVEKTATVDRKGAEALAQSGFTFVILR
jgi:valyl-tRNA synthetase